MIREIEAPLGEDAAKLPTREEVAKVWAETLRKPVPLYPPHAIHRLRQGFRS